MKLRWPLHRRFRISCDAACHEARTPPSAKAIDIAAPAGEPVFSIASGMIEVAEGKGPGGLRVWVNHGKDDEGRVWKSYMAHLSSLEVVKLQIIPAGFKVGEVGSTGKSTGDHLHISVTVDREYIDPMLFIEPPS